MLTKKQKIVHAIIFVMIVLFIVGGVNYYVDSYAQVRISYTDIAKELAEGKNVTGLTESRYNERYLAVAMIEVLDEAPECIMLGTSRSMIYGKEQFDAQSFYNFSLAGGTLNDYYGVIGYLADKDMLPKKVILEVGGPLFNEEDTEQRYTYLQGGIDYMEALLQKEQAVCEYPKVDNQYLKVFAIDYFKYNLQCLFEGTRFEVEYTDEMNNVQSTKLSDGSLTYGEDGRMRSEEYVEAATSKALAEKNLYKIEGYNEMSPRLTLKFEKLVAWLMEKGVEVELFLPPYSQPMYEFMEEHKEDYAGVFSQEEYILSYANEWDIKLYGSYSPEGCNLLMKDLSDEYHMQRESAYKAWYLR